jgi:hypothetical protein
MVVMVVGRGYVLALFLAFQNPLRLAVQVTKKIRTNLRKICITLGQFYV